MPDSVDRLIDWLLIDWLILLQDLVEKATEGFELDAPAAFDDFVNELRDSSNLDDVLAVMRQHANGQDLAKFQVAKHLLVQGLVQCNAPACLRALSSLMDSEEISRAVFEPVLMALALTKQRDPLFLNELKEMCEERPTRMCTLMVGALAHRLVEDDEDIMEDQKAAEQIEEGAIFRFLSVVFHINSRLLCLLLHQLIDWLIDFYWFFKKYFAYVYVCNFICQI